MTGPITYVSRLDFQSIRVLIHFHLTLLDNISLVDAIFACGINVEQIGAVRSLKFQTTESILPGYAPRMSSSQATSPRVCYSYRNVK
jgi:hypothetical protein